jgi:hypothetical protein
VVSTEWFGSKAEFLDGSMSELTSCWGPNEKDAEMDVRCAVLPGGEGGGVDVEGVCRRDILSTALRVYRHVVSCLSLKASAQNHYFARGFLSP